MFRFKFIQMLNAGNDAYLGNMRAFAYTDATRLDMAMFFQWYTQSISICILDKRAWLVLRTGPNSTI